MTITGVYQFKIRKGAAKEPMAKNKGIKRNIMILVCIILFIGGYSQSTVEEHSKAIEKADEYFQQGDYINAKAAYQLASRLDPEDDYAKKQLRESLQLLRGQIEKKGKFNSKIKIADELFENKSYDKAKKAYNEALQILPDETYPKVQIKNLDEIIEQEKVNRQNYESAIAKADQYFNDGKLNNALGSYQDALKHIAYEEYPGEKIREIESILAKRNAVQNKYEGLLQEADDFLRRKNYKRALESFTKASEMKPEESLPRQKIDELNDFLVSYEKYNKLITAADELYIDKQYASARLKYEQALEILPDERYPKDLITKIDATLNEKAIENWEKYDELIAEGDKYFSQEDYEKAMETYNSALRFKPDETYARTKIKSIMEIMDLRRSKEEAYSNTIAKADNLFKEGNYNEALLKYKQAHELKPIEPYPKVRTDEIEVILAELKNKNEIFEKTLAGADKLFNSEDYGQALIQYTKALEILPGKQYPKDQITMINDILNREKSSQEAYEKAIVDAGLHFDNEEYDEAKLDYMTAMDIKPDEEYPKEKITEINNILAMLKARQESFAIAVKDADQLFEEKKYELALSKYEKAAGLMKDDAHVGARITEIKSILEEKETLDQEYTTLIEDADKLYQEEAWVEAKNKYNAALGLKPGEAYAMGQITQIDARMDEIASQMALDDQYNTAIENAEQYFRDEAYEDAIASYRMASELKKEANLPVTRIKEIEILQNNLVLYENLNAEGDKLFEQGNFELAVEKYSAAGAIFPEKDYHKYKITEAESALDKKNRKIALNREYDSLLARGDDLLNQKNYLSAKENYISASTLKPRETYPKEKLEEIDAILTEQARREEIQANYENAIAAGDRFFDMKQWNEAKSEYSKALALKPDETYPKEKIAETDTFLAEISRQQAIDEKYNTIISEADLHFSEGDLVAARVKYQEALTVKEGEAYAQERITAIDIQLEAIAKQEALDNQYNKLIEEANMLRDSKNYDKAVTKFQEALTLKPEESYPNEKISEIEQILQEIARQQEIDAEYNRHLQIADQHFENEEYSEALSAYNEARTIKPNEEYPIQRIIDINDILERLAEEKEKAYNLAITRGDNLFNEKNYKESIEAYRTALSLKPEESYPKERMNQAESLYLAEIEALTKIYRQLVGEADAFFNERIYDNAIDKYIEAHDVLPENPYPMNMVRKITKIINDNAIVDINQNTILIPENTTKKFSFSPMPVNVRKENYILLKARNPVKREFKIIVSFGQNGSKNGGVAIRVPESDEEKDYIIRLGSQYKWFSEDNNWVSIYPEGGEIEVGLIRISKSD